MITSVRKDLNKFLNFCINSFGEERGKQVYSFYRDVLLYPKNTSSNKLGSLTDRRIKNIEFILENFSEEAFFKILDLFQESYKNKTLASRQVSYFQSAVKNTYLGISKPKTYVKPLTPITIVQKTSIPLKFKKVREDMGEEYLNWDFSCSCGTVVDPWKDECPKCHVKFNWKKVGV